MSWGSRPAPIGTPTKGQFPLVIQRVVWNLSGVPLRCLFTMRPSGLQSIIVPKSKLKVPRPLKKHPPTAPHSVYANSKSCLEYIGAPFRCLFTHGHPASIKPTGSKRLRQPTLLRLFLRSDEQPGKPRQFRHCGRTLQPCIITCHPLFICLQAKIDQ